MYISNVKHEVGLRIQKKIYLPNLGFEMACTEVKEGFKGTLITKKTSFFIEIWYANALKQYLPVIFLAKLNNGTCKT